MREIPEGDLEAILKAARTEEPGGAFVDRIEARAREIAPGRASRLPLWACAAAAVVSCAAWLFHRGDPALPPIANYLYRTLGERLDARDTVVAGEVVSSGGILDGTTFRVRIDDRIRGTGTEGEWVLSYPPNDTGGLWRPDRGARGIFFLSEGRMRNETDFLPARTDDIYTRLRNLLRGYEDGSALRTILQHLATVPAETIPEDAPHAIQLAHCLIQDDWATYTRPSDLARDLSVVPAFRAPEGIRTTIAFLRENLDTPATRPALSLLVTAGGYEAEAFLAEAVSGRLGEGASAEAGRLLRTLATGNRGDVLPARVVVQGPGPGDAPEALAEYIYGIFYRLADCRVGLFGRVATPEGEDLERGMRLESVGIFQIPDNLRDLPEVWGRPMDADHREDVDLGAYGPGTWVLLLVDEAGRFGEGGPQRIAPLGSEADAWALAVRIRAVARRDAALAPALLAELARGGGDLPWSTPEDLIVDIAAVGDDAAARDLRAWARSQPEGDLRSAAETAADRIDLVETVRADHTRALEKFLALLRDPDWSTREAGTDSLREWLRTLGRGELLWLKDDLDRRMEGMDPETRTRLDHLREEFPLLQR